MSSAFSLSRVSIVPAASVTQFEGYSNRLDLSFDTLKLKETCKTRGISSATRALRVNNRFTTQYRPLKSREILGAEYFSHCSTKTLRIWLKMVYINANLNSFCTESLSAGKRSMVRNWCKVDLNQLEATSPVSKILWCFEIFLKRKSYALLKSFHDNSARALACFILSFSSPSTFSSFPVAMWTLFFFFTGLEPSFLLLNVKICNSFVSLFLFA